MDAMSDDSRLMSQSEIEELLKQSSPAAPSTPPSAPASAAPEGMLAQNEIEALLAGSKSQPAPTSAPPPAASGEQTVSQDDIQALFAQTAGKPVGATSAARPGPRPMATEMPGGMASGDIEYLFNQAQEALNSVDAPRNPGPLAGIAPFKLEEFGGAAASTEVATLELIRDVELDLKIELGRTQMYLEEVLKLRKGSVVPLDKLAGDPVDIYVNGRLIARGEVLVLNDNFCVRVAELIAPETAKAG
jgi:flagellar motor switch protein FliN/FliY